jgi:ribonuclease HII
VVAAAVILPERDCPGGINDSKKLTEKTRALLCRDPRLRGGRRGIVHPEEIDRLNIYWATMKAMTLAVDAVVETLGGHPAHVLVDGNRLPKWGMPPPRSSGAMPVAGDRRGLDRGQACPRRDDRGGRAMARLWLAQQHGVWIGAHLAALREHGPRRSTAAASPPWRNVIWTFDPAIGQGEDFTGESQSPHPVPWGQSYPHPNICHEIATCRRIWRNHASRACERLLTWTHSGWMRGFEGRRNIAWG